MTLIHYVYTYAFVIHFLFFLLHWMATRHITKPKRDILREIVLGAIWVFQFFILVKLETFTF